MARSLLDQVARAHGGRVIAALAAKYRDLDLAEEAFADACLKAAEAWPKPLEEGGGEPRDPAAWLYSVAQRRALDRLRRRGVRTRLVPDPPQPPSSAEDVMTDEARLIPDERLRLIFVCCHPAVAPDARAALTLRLVCGLSTQEIARAFLVSEQALAQRLVRAKRKIAQAGVSFEVPGPEAWPERLGAVLSTLEIAYAKAHEDAAGAGQHAGYAQEMLDLTAVLVELLPNEPECLAFAALVRYAEARRPARLDETGAMTPLSEQDPALWRRPLILEAAHLLLRAVRRRRPGPRQLAARLHAVWCSRASLAEPPPWPAVLDVYDELLAWRDDAVVRLNRAVAVAEVSGPAVALAQVDELDGAALRDFGPFHAVRADLLARLGRSDEAVAAYDRVLALDPAPAERLWLERRRGEVAL